MESNERYYARRAVEELRALERAVTPEAKARRLALAEAFQLKARQCGPGQADQKLSSRAREISVLACETSQIRANIA
ncbi:MAG TPA: hypothetical protein VE053_01830 [Allosphingosinicella sp.]|nr:hypothetical protein [Allosphingosinicella sp.]